jgi:hypothetical protein
MIRFLRNGQSAGIAVVALACLLSASALSAQTATGRIIGNVTDSTGAAIPGVSITVTNVQTQSTFQTITNEQGAYQVPLLPIGTYTVTAELPGFQKAVTKPDKLEINQALRVDIKMVVGNRTEEIVVTEGISHVDTITPTMGASIVGSQIANMPLNGRNVLDLALLVPGVVPAVAGAGTVSIAGARGDSVTYLLDGGINNNLLSNLVVFNPNPDTVGEFRILLNNYTAEYGRNAGGIISVVTKSGTNDFHGTAYDYVRNDALNANTFFNNQNKIRKDILKRNQFGATFGGPVKRDKLFFFSAWQSQRQSALQVTSKTALFTPAELNGDFSLSNTTRTGPDTNVAAFLQKFPYFQSDAAKASQAIIDPAKFNSVAKNYINAKLIPSDPAGSKIYQDSAKDNNDEITEKGDYQLTSSDRISVTLGWKSRTVLNPFSTANVSGYPIDTFTKNYFFAANYVKTISSSLLNEFRFTAQRNNSLQSVPAANAPKPKDLGIAINSDNPTGPPILSFSSGMTVGFSPQGPSNLIDNTFTWSDSLSWFKGKHAFKTGAQFTPYQDNQVFDFFIDGEFFFKSTNGNTVYSKNDRADFLMGLADEFEQFPAAPSNIRTKNFGAFFQDEWKVRHNVTLTLGMRYEYNTPKLDTQGRTFTWGTLATKSTVFPNAPAGLLFPGDAAAPRGSNFPDKNDFAPRFGIAWAPTKDGRLSIRGGLGVFYDILKAEDNFQFNGQPPFFPGADISGYPAITVNPTSEPLNFASPFAAANRPNPFPASPPTASLDFQKAGFVNFGGGGVYSVNPHIRTPYIYQYNFDIQKELKGRTIVDVAYAGSSSHKLTGLYDSNPFPLGGTTRILNMAPNPSNAFSYLSTFGNVANAHYHSLQVGVKRVAAEAPILGNIGYQLSYTFSKSIDNASGFRSRDARVPTYAPGLFRAVSDHDIPHNINLSGFWELPFQKVWKSGPSRLLTGWNVIPSMSYRSGTPLDVTSGLGLSAGIPGPSGAGDNSLVRANILAPIKLFDPHVYQPFRNRAGNYWFDPTIFQQIPNSTPGVGNFGTFGRNALRGPSQFNTNFLVSKVVRVRESLNVEYRAEFFNMLNHAQFNTPSTSITSSLFGQISGTAPSRIIQMALRLQF